MAAALSIAGFDPSAGAGILMDQKAFRKRGVYGMAVITALTVQDNRKVYRVENVDAKLYEESIRVLLETKDIRAVKLGMIASKEQLKIVSENMKSSDIPLVIDPVLGSSSGFSFFEEELRSSYEELFRWAQLVTPNLEEVKVLLRQEGSQRQLTEAFYRRYQVPVLVKGGHLEGDPIDLFFDGERVEEFRFPRLPFEIHGTGCALSSLITAGLAEAESLRQSVETSVRMLHSWIEDSLQLSKGPRVLL